MAKANLQQALMPASRSGMASAQVNAGIIQKILEQAIGDHQKGEAPAARSGYEAVLAVQPNNPDALQFLGILLHQAGESETGLDHLRRAVAARPGHAIGHNNLGGILKDMKRFEEAEQAFSKAIALSPDYADAHMNRGNVLFALDRFADAEAEFLVTLSLEPKRADALRQLGHVALKKNRFEDSEVFFRRYIALRPDSPAEISNLGHVVQQQGRFDEAEAFYRQALAMAGGSNPTLYHNLRSVLELQDRSDEGREGYRQALRETPDIWHNEIFVAFSMYQRGRIETGQGIIEDILAVHGENPDVLNDIGAAYMSLGKVDESEKMLRRAIKIAPDSPIAHANLGNLLLNANYLEPAIASYLEALRCDPSYIQAQVEITRAYRLLSQYDKAHIYGRAALDMPKYHVEQMILLVQLFKSLCDYESLDRMGDIWANSDKQKIEGLPSLFLDLLVFARDREETRKFVELTAKWGKFIEAQVKRGPLEGERPKSADGRIRVGLLSSDLRSHSVSRFLLPFMLRHDKAKISLHAYTPHRQTGDAIQEMFRKACDKFVFVDNMSDRDIAETIRADGIDILLDLNGFTQETRVGVLGYKPAPVQMSWLGYPFTCGMKEIDYVVMDRFVVPDDETTLFEQALVMPDAWVCFGKFPNVDINPVLPMERNGYVTFGTLNNPYKYSREMIEAWAKVMLRVPGSRMLFVRPEASSTVLVRNLAEEFAKHGVSSDRLYFFNNHEERRNHLEYYNEIDISLDSFPLTGGTTTCEATWMGVPVVSLVGEAFHQRISYSVLMQCGFEELCTFNVPDFIERAVALAGDRDKLAFYRAEMREILQASPLCDEDRFLHQFQDMLGQVADLHGLR